MFDRDMSGKIDKDEIVALLSGDDLSNVVSKDAIGKAMKEID
jgi:Ca2+-binding EF-hand superfamily protein